MGELVVRIFSEAQGGRGEREWRETGSERRSHQVKTVGREGKSWLAVTRRGERTYGQGVGALHGARHGRAHAGGVRGAGRLKPHVLVGGGGHGQDHQKQQEGSRH